MFFKSSFDILVKTYWNKKYKKEKKIIPYHGYQDPNEIDWSVYGPDRPGKKPPPDTESIFSSLASDTQVISVFSFFGLLLPGCVQMVVLDQAPDTIGRKMRSLPKA